MWRRPEHLPPRAGRCVAHRPLLRQDLAPQLPAAEHSAPPSAPDPMQYPHRLWVVCMAISADQKRISLTVITSYQYVACIQLPSILTGEGRGQASYMVLQSWQPVFLFLTSDRNRRRTLGVTTLLGVFLPLCLPALIFIRSLIGLAATCSSASCVDKGIALYIGSPRKTRVHTHKQGSGQHTSSSVRFSAASATALFAVVFPGKSNPLTDGTPSLTGPGHTAASKRQNGTNGVCKKGDKSLSSHCASTQVL